MNLRALWLLVGLGLLGKAAVAGPVVVPVVGKGGADPALEDVVFELAQRCPGASKVPKDALRPLLPRFHQPGEVAAAPLPSEEELNQWFYQGDDWPGLLLRLNRLQQALLTDPVRLLAVPRARLLLHRVLLLSIRALERTGDMESVRGMMGLLATRLPDMPPPTQAEWGHTLHQVAKEVWPNLPAEDRTLVIQGPAGFAVHVDELPRGALPEVQVRLRPGPHGVVVVMPDGSKASWVLEVGPGGLSQAAQQVRLLVDPQLQQLCSVGGLTGLCGEGEVQQGAQALSRLLANDLLLVRSDSPGALSVKRLSPQSTESPLTVTLQTPLQRSTALAEIHRHFCVQPPSVSVTKSAESRPRRGYLGPSLLLSAGGVALAFAIPGMVISGHCVDPECTRVYNFRGVPEALVGVSGGLLLGGSIWLALSARRRP